MMIAYEKETARTEENTKVIKFF